MTDKKDQIVKLSPQQNLLKKMYPAIIKSLPQHKDPQRFVGIILTVLNKNPKLMKCTLPSLMGSIMLSSILGLELGSHLGQCFIVPYDNKGRGLEAQFQIGYKGYPILLKDSLVYAHCVYEGEKWGYQYGLNKDIFHKPDPECIKKGKVEAAYAVIKNKNGFTDFLVIHADELEKFRKLSKSDAWKNWDGEMYRKAPLKRLSKTAPLSAEDKRLISVDETTKYYKPDMDPQHLLDMPDETDWTNGVLIEPERERPPLNTKGKKKAAEKIDSNKDPSQTQDAEIKSDSKAKVSKKTDAQGDLFDGEINAPDS